jgi:Tol biopolymer transport system component
VRLVLVWTGISALLIPGASLWGQVASSEGQIAYISRRGAWGEIVVIDVRTRIAHSIMRLIDVDQIAWSENGAFAFTIRYGENSHITVSDLQGLEVRQLTDDSGFDTNLNWSPDGRWLAFQSNSPRGTDIFVIDPTATNARQLTSGPDFEGDPTWSPDGRQIAFRSDRGGSSGLYVMDMDGNKRPASVNNEARRPHGRPI